MGKEAEDTLRSFAMSEEDKKTYQPVTAKFEAHFVKKHDIYVKKHVI